MEGRTTGLRRTAAVALFLGSAGSVAGAVLAGSRDPVSCRALATASAVLLAAGVTAVPRLRGARFAAWVAAAVTASLSWPAAFGTWLGYDLKGLIVPLIQVIMFGMGTTLAARDFLRVLAMPLPVAIGVVLQFAIMPLVGFGLAWSGMRFFAIDPEVAAGIVLIGSVSGGVASNVMAYLAGGNVSLSVTMTACSTLLSPVITPFLMKVLAGRMVTVDFLAMCLEIVSMVILPVFAGLLANRVLYGISPSFSRTLDRALPFVSMLGICFIIAIITARSRDQLLAVGPILVGAAVVHNFLGYGFGYGLARACGLDETTARTISFEVGMQNGGMASGLAMGVLKSPAAAIAPAIFGPWMNISGSILASWWRRRPPAARAAGRPESAERPEAAALPEGADQK